MTADEFHARADAIFARLRVQAPELFDEPIARVPFTEEACRKGAGDAIGGWE